MTYSKRVREQAADALAICACQGHWAMLTTAVVLPWSKSERLARDAYLAVYEHMKTTRTHMNWRECYAEAEALIRSGDL